jgi:hypothetical protein
MEWFLFYAVMATAATGITLMLGRWHWSPSAAGGRGRCKRAPRATGRSCRDGGKRFHGFIYPAAAAENCKPV